MRHAYRAAGQALAAHLHGAQIAELDLLGITLFYPHRTPRRTLLLTELAVGLAGVEAISRYQFGWPDSPAPIVSFSFIAGQLADMEDAHAIVAELASSGDDDVFFEAWPQASDLIGDPFQWRVIDRAALLLSRSPCDPIDIHDIIEDMTASAEFALLS